MVNRVLQAPKAILLEGNIQLPTQSKMQWIVHKNSLAKNMTIHDDHKAAGLNQDAIYDVVQSLNDRLDTRLSVHSCVLIEATHAFYGPAHQKPSTN